MNSEIKGKKILVVDDEVDLREILVSELQAAGAQTFEASNGSEGFLLATKEDVDAIVSDVRMPGGSGIELLQKLKEKNPTRPAVILVSGFSDLNDSEAYNMGADVLLTKPFDLEMLLASVSRAFSQINTGWRRASPERVKVDHSVELYMNSENGERELQIINIGRGGIFIGMELNFPKENSIVEFRVLFPDFNENKTIAFTGKGICRWIRPGPVGQLPPGVGLEFVDLSDESQEYLKKLLNSRHVKPYIPSS